VSLSITSDASGACKVYWGVTPVTQKELLDRAVAKLKTEIDRQGGPNAAGLELPEAHVRGDVDTPWHCIGGAIFNMQQAGFARVGFISQPGVGGA
jgi:biopolymer transport protein ExbD